MKNKILCLYMTSIHKSLNILLPILKDRISHTRWLLQTGRARKEDYGLFSLTAASSRVSNTSYSPNWITIHSMMSSSQSLTHQCLGLCLKPPILPNLLGLKWLLAWALKGSLGWVSHKKAQRYWNNLAHWWRLGFLWVWGSFG